MYMYGKSNYEECGCCKEMSYNDRKKDDQLDDIKDLLKKILHENKENNEKKEYYERKHNRKDNKKDNHDEDCEVATVAFTIPGLVVETPDAGSTLFGCAITPDQNIDDLLQCLFNKGFRIRTYVASNGFGVYTLVRCN